MKVCTSCNTYNNDDAVFCKNCGEKLPEQKENTLIVENDTPMNKATLKQIYRNNKFLSFCDLVCGAIILLSAIIQLILGEEDGFFYLFLGVIFTTAGVFLYLTYNTCVNKNKVATENTHVVFRFFDDEFFALTFDGDEKKEESHLSYNKISKVKKVGKFYFLFLGASALVLNPENFTLGDKEKFISLLKEKCDKNTVKIKLK